MRHVEVITVCDIDGSDSRNVQPYAWSFDGRDYEIDLCVPHLDQLRAKLRELAKAGRLAKPAPRGRRSAGYRTAADRRRAAEIRRWARRKGLDVSEKGRIPPRIIEQYLAEH